MSRKRRGICLLGDVVLPRLNLEGAPSCSPIKVSRFNHKTQFCTSITKMNRRVVSKPKEEPSPLAKVEKKVSDALTVLWADIPKWQQDNVYITSGYRPPTNSFAKSFSSLGYLHNETVNIWSHLLGAITAVTFGFFAYNQIHPRYERANDTDILVFSCYFIGATACLGMSATYHAISNHSQRVNKIGNQLDYVGIVALIWGSFVPSIYYGFGRDPELIWTYLTMVL